MNKKKKILLIVILLIIAIIGIYIFLKGKAYVKASTSEVPEPFIINITEQKMTYDYNNVYNVDYIQQLIKSDTEYAYETTGLAQIRGEEVTFTNYYYGSTDYKTKNIKTSQGKTCTENNIMAAIINGAGLKGVGHKMLDGRIYNFSSVQLAIWEFWNTWIEHTGAKENGFEKGMGNTNIYEDEYEGKIERKIAQSFATQKKYYANIYFLKYSANNNLNTTDENGFYLDNQPNLIYIEILDENGNIKEPEIKEKEEVVETDSSIYLDLTSSQQNVVKAGEEIIYDVVVNNTSEEEQQNLILKDILSEGITFVKVIEIIDNFEVELNNNEAYNYNEETKILTVNLDKVDRMEKGTEEDNETGENIEYTRNGRRVFRITVITNELEDGVYSKEIKNTIKVYQNEKLLAKEDIVNIISGPCLEIEVEELPENINEQEECIIGLKIKNKGLLNAGNVDVNILIPEEISMSIYRIILLSETGEELNVNEGTMLNEFNNSHIEIPAQNAVYIQLIGITNKINENKQITIEGTVDENQVSWITNIQKITDDKNVALERGGN